MADLADKAAAGIEQHNEASLRNRTTYQGESAEACIECGAEIPPRRRAAIPGVQRCVECQELAEHPSRSGR